MTFCNPLTLSVGSERARRAGEPVVVLYKDDYYLFITGGRGYWYSGNMRDWTYVDAPVSREAVRQLQVMVKLYMHPGIKECMMYSASY